MKIGDQGRWELSIVLFLRDFRAQYRESLLGYVWAFVPPIVMAAGFTLARNAGVVNIASTDIAYPAFVMLSMVLWQTFAEALQAPIKGMSEARAILNRVAFPVAAILWAKALQVATDFGIKLVLVLAVFILYDVTPASTLLVALLPLIGLVVFGFSIGLCLAPLGMLSQDISRGLTVVLGLWLMLTPVVYPMPDGPSMLSTVVKWNPVSALLDATRSLMLYGDVARPWTSLFVALGGVLLLALGWRVLRVALPRAIERMGS